jgi:hypothetical protein
VVAAGVRQSRAQRTLREPQAELIFERPRIEAGLTKPNPGALAEVRDEGERGHQPCHCADLLRGAALVG